MVASIEHIYEVSKKDGVFKKPAPVSNTTNKDKSKYCAYHETYGHQTHECRHLKEEIETLIREGKLTEWVVREVKKYKEDTKSSTIKAIEGKEKTAYETTKKTREGSIHTIFGGPHIGGTGRYAMKKYVEEAMDKPLTNVSHISEMPPKMFKGEDTQIIFSEEDARWVHHPHSDALVVNIRIGSRSVH